MTDFLSAQPPVPHWGKEGPEMWAQTMLLIGGIVILFHRLRGAMVREDLDLKDKTFRDLLAQRPIH